MAGVVELEPTLTVLETAVLPITPNPYMAANQGLEPRTYRLTADCYYH